MVSSLVAGQVQQPATKELRITMILLVPKSFDMFYLISIVYLIKYRIFDEYCVIIKTYQLELNI